MSSPPLPSALLADRLAWLACEVRSEKEDAGIIVAAFMEVFARLLARLAGFAARIEAGTLPQGHLTPSLALTAPIAAPIASGLVPRVFGWLGALLPVGRPIAIPADVALPHTEQLRFRISSPKIASAWVATQARTETPANCSQDVRVSGADIDVARATLEESGSMYSRRHWWHSASVGGRLAAWRPLPASTAGPFSNSQFPPMPKYARIVTVSQQL